MGAALAFCFFGWLGFFNATRMEVLQRFAWSSNGLLIKAFLIIMTSLCSKSLDVVCNRLVCQSRDWFVILFFFTTIYSFRM